jgi:hypothetical protein
LFSAPAAEFGLALKSGGWHTWTFSIFGVVFMRRSKKASPTWFRRATQPIREFLRVDIDMTEQATRRVHPSAQRLLCAPSQFLLWILDELERTAEDLRGLLTLRRSGSRPVPPSEPAE